MQQYLGKQIGEGKCRKVYEHRDSKDLVIKAETMLRKPAEYCNRIEWFIWHNCHDLRPYLVPALSIHQSGLYLVMERGKPVDTDDVPQTPPHPCIEDMGRKNWVWHDGQVKLCDYGETKALQRLFGIKRFTHGIGLEV